MDMILYMMFLFVVSLSLLLEHIKIDEAYYNKKHNMERRADNEED